MASMTVNVVRYTALFTGVLYGVMHKRTLQSVHDQKKEHAAHHHHEELVARAKDAWRQKQTSMAGDGIISNPDDPKFDLEKLLQKYEKES